MREDTCGNLLRITGVRPRLLKDDRMSEMTTRRALARYLTNEEAAAYLRLSPRTLEKRRVIGGGPRFRKFCGRVFYALHDLEAWAEARSFEMTCDPEYLALRRNPNRRA